MKITVSDGPGNMPVGRMLQIQADTERLYDGPRIGDTRVCPESGCGRPQHYTGIELGWCHDALTDTWHCADPRKAGA